MSARHGERRDPAVDGLVEGLGRHARAGNPAHARPHAGEALRRRVPRVVLRAETAADAGEREEAWGQAAPQLLVVQPEVRADEREPRGAAGRGEGHLVEDDLRRNPPREHPHVGQRPALETEHPLRDLEADDGDEEDRQQPFAERHRAQQLLQTCARSPVVGIAACVLWSRDAHPSWFSPAARDTGSPSPPMTTRLVPLEGCLNFRDLGGYPTADGRTVRWRQIYRSDALHLLTPADITLVRDELRVRDVIDLRSSAEVRSEGQGPLAESDVRFHHVPLYDGEVRAEDRERAAQISLADRYVFLADLAKDRIGRVVTTVATAEAGAVFHCAAGKDRTGVISAILLGLLGVPDEVIVADYVATRENLDAIVERLNSLEGYRAMLAALPPETMHANPETMVEFLGRLRDAHGSFEKYAAAAGVSSDVVERLRSRLLTGE